MIFEIAFPVKNEEDALKEFLKELSLVTRKLDNHQFLLLFFDDGSLDRSPSIFEEWARSSGVISRYIRMSSSVGYARVIAKMVMYISPTVDAAIFLDADLQDPPAVIFDLIKKFEQTGESVVAVRKKTVTNFNLEEQCSRFFHFLARAVNFEKWNCGTFGLYSQKLIQKLQMENRTEIYLPHRLQAEVNDSSCIFYERQSRLYARSRASWSGTVGISKNSH